MKWFTARKPSKAGIQEVHIVPADDQVAHELTEKCVCGPLRKRVYGGQHPDLVVHFSLDGRELQE